MAIPVGFTSVIFNGAVSKLNQLATTAAWFLKLAGPVAKTRAMFFDARPRRGM
ncbi:hypothetical protein Q31b_47200 [Novipirellula aureliae]|uniref:Uncharacterized protein n=1 Tax=Novipirellula aureliae TaxID=2527966 RepID=A0A5C6DQL5_9BACT|nr:hypothetical protein Q31b_47200 [Novipirellula aureliae]